MIRALLMCCGACLAVSTLRCANKTTYYSSKELGISVTDLDWTQAKHTVTAAGDDEYTEDAHVILGSEEHELLIDEIAETAEHGGKMTLKLDDRSLKASREETPQPTTTYRYDPAAKSLTFTVGADTSIVIRNPDGSYSVDGAPAANGKAAVELLKQKPAYQKTSKWSLALTYSLCINCEQRSATRGRTICNTGRGSRARDEAPMAEPAVCDSFPDLCECVVCDKLQKSPCTKCP